MKFSEETLKGIRAKQAARMLLAKQAELVKDMLKEGLITQDYAEEVIH
jgi:hypothetical protein